MSHGEFSRRSACQCVQGRTGPEVVALSDVAAFLRIYDKLRADVSGTGKPGNGCLTQAVEAVFSEYRCSGCGVSGSGGVRKVLERSDSKGWGGSSQCKACVECYTGADGGERGCYGEDGFAGGRGGREYGECRKCRVGQQCGRGSVECDDGVSAECVAGGAAGNRDVGGADRVGAAESEGCGADTGSVGRVCVSDGESVGACGQTRVGGGVASVGADGGGAECVGSVSECGDSECSVGGDGTSPVERLVSVETCAVPAVDPDVVGVSRGVHYARNKQRRERDRRRRQEGKKPAVCGESDVRASSDGVPEWRRGARPAVGAAVVGTPSLSASVRTVDTRTAEEIEAARTLALRRTAENKVAVAVAQHRLVSLKNKEKTDALMRLQVAKIEEQVNTTRAKSQASYKKCGSPLESVGSAMSAGEFGWKQSIRKLEAMKKKLEYIEAQNMELCKYASAEGLRIVSQMPEPYIPTDEEIEAEDEDISPYPSMEEMQAHAAAMCGDDYPW